MKNFLYTVIFIVLAHPFISGAADINKKDLRNGYSLHTLVTESGNIKQLFHKEKLLGESHSYSIAPSGEYVVFQDAPSGQLFLYRVSDDALIQLANASPGSVKSYKWNETLEVVQMFFENEQEALSFAIE